MHSVARVDWSFAATPNAASSTASGLSRSVLVSPATGAAHTELAVGSLAPGGWLARHVHSFEEALYVLEGTLVFESDGHVHRLVAGDYALNPIGRPHTLAATRDEGVRWLSVNTPPRRAPDAAVADTIFSSHLARRRCHDRGGRRRSARSDPTRRLVGHYAGTPPQAEALALGDPARGRAPAGMDTALLAYSGISVKMLVDRPFGAEHLTMFTVDYEVGGAAQAHDHPFEEAYFFVAGNDPGRARWRAVHLRARGRRVRGRRERARLLERRTGARPLDRDPGAPAARAPGIPLAVALGGTRGGRGSALAARPGKPRITSRRIDG